MPTVLPTLLLLTLLTAALIQVVAAVAAARAGRYAVVDVAWGLGSPLIALVTWAAAPQRGDPRPLLVLLLTVAWGLRLAGHLAARQRADPAEDRRYTDLFARGDRAGRGRLWTALTRVHLVQGAAMTVVALPVPLTMATGGGVGPLTVAGVVLAVIGLVFETVGDRQLVAFRRRPDSAGRVLDSGLWRWTRHPNYFGDACLWWGLALIAAQVWPGPVALLGPLLLTVLLVRVSGAALLERDIAGRRPAYADYVRRTSAFVPWPPRPPAAGPRDEQHDGAG